MKAYILHVSLSNSYTGKKIDPLLRCKVRSQHKYNYLYNESTLSEIFKYVNEKIRQGLGQRSQDHTNFQPCSHVHIKKHLVILCFYMHLHAVYNMENTKRWTTIYAHTDTYVQHHNMQTPHREARVSQQV